MNGAILHAFEQELGDARIECIGWAGDDLQVDLVLPGIPTRALCLRFEMVSRLEIHFDYGEYVGQPLLFAGTLKEIANSRWRVRFDFGVAPDGFIQFECSDVSERPPTA